MPTPGTGRGHQRIKGDTHRSTFGTGESHHTSLASGSGGTRGTRASVLTSGTLLGGGKAPLEEPMASQGGRRRRRRGHQRGQLTGGPVLPSGPGLPGLPVRPCEEKEEREELRGCFGDAPENGSVLGCATEGRTALSPCHCVTSSPWHRGVRVLRGVRLHQEILWGPRGRGSRARRGDPGERGTAVTRGQGATRSCCDNGQSPQGCADLNF